MIERNLMEHMTETSGWRDLSPAAQVFGEGNSIFFNTGDWRSETPSWNRERCKQCLLCFPVCPDSSIPVSGGKRHDFDFEHCKGCGVCAKTCPFGAISMFLGTAPAGASDAAIAGGARAAAAANTNHAADKTSAAPAAARAKGGAK